ncbi:hypothetical protein KOR42_30960 [Thalassoglobus neptunius]|uniref:Uncharacterized protein n=1 Tax=Thalassoglobus neptunius TaxID=1938619 RepID=A0A5C5WNL8_9PLAN|nr:hypothetical protein KOR42_30960 [Thalassoglobus neptunius]
MNNTLQATTSLKGIVDLNTGKLNHLPQYHIPQLGRHQLRRHQLWVRELAMHLTRCKK